MPDVEKPAKEFEVVAAEIAVVAFITLIILAIFGGHVNQILEIYNKFLESFYAVDWQKVNNILSVAFTIFGIAMIVAVLLTIRKYYQIKEKTNATTASQPAPVVTPADEVKESWVGIMDLMNSTNPSDWNMAVLRADALLDEILIKLGYEGETMADRLKIVNSRQIPSLERVWAAHRLRNNIAHDPLEQNTREIIVYAVKAYEQALTELGMMKKS